MQVTDGVSLPRAGVVLTGNAPVTGHPASARRSPARPDADVVLPGTGPLTGRTGCGAPGRQLR